MATGTVQSYSETEGYGFIIPDDGSEDIFFRADIIETCGFYVLQAGDRVIYGIRDSSTGIEASVVIFWGNLN